MRSLFTFAKRTSARAALCVGLTFGAFALVSCGPPPKPPAAEPAGAAWQDAVEGNEALVAVVRPKAVMHDQVFGPLFHSALMATMAHEGSTPSLDVLAATDELIVVSSADRRTGTMLVLSGVPADKSPDRIGDDHGQALFQKGAETKTVSEWPSTRGGDLSLFVLPHRTWVIASDGILKRARQAFATPSGRPMPSYGDEKALAIVRIDGTELLKGRPRAHGLMGSVTEKLDAVIAELMPDKKGVNVTVRYKNDDQAGFSAIALEDIKKRLVGDASRRFQWLSTATIAREGNRDVKIHVDLPPDFMDQMRRASPQDLINL
jgi:hypothetical protein